MDTISPVVADAYRLLHSDLYGHLDEAEFLALKYRQWSQQDSDAARESIPDLVVVIRGVLIESRGGVRWRLPNLHLAVALPGGHDNSRAGERPRPRVRRSPPQGPR
jgi:hypothetical protein